jgi:hypothetical protein
LYPDIGCGLLQLCYKEGPKSMGFDEEETSSESAESSKSNESSHKKPTTFFGLEVSDGVVYTLVIILGLIFARQVSIVLQAL